MELKLGLYEQLINQLVGQHIKQIDTDTYFIKETLIDKAEAAEYLSRYLADLIKQALSSLKKDDDLLKNQIGLANSILQLLNDRLSTNDFSNDLIDTQGRILNAVISKINSDHADIAEHIQKITPYTRFSQSELFTGGATNVSITLESELKKEIQSANEIYFLVSFIKFAGIRIFYKELEDFTKNGGKLKIITTSYMGATDLKAIELLSKLRNTEIKISYNTQAERLHAKAYLFIRDTGFHTGYIGSSNLSRSAVTNGMEWNIKITTKEVRHLIDKFKKTFETYWKDTTFETFDSSQDVIKLKTSLEAQRATTSINTTFFDITPHHYQKEILEKLIAERQIHNRFKNLIVAATGTGKTVIAAFDFQKFLSTNRYARLLFVAHRKEILLQALGTFRGVLKDTNFGELWVDGMTPTKLDRVFASVQTLNSQLSSKNLTADYYDYIVIDEVHHIAANSYRPIIQRFTPTILLGLTATPERMDNENILSDFCNVIAAEIRLPEALNQQLLCPFHYFGISDSIDLSTVRWEKGKYAQSELETLYTGNNQRLGEIVNNLNNYLTDPRDVRALGFCVSQQHARFMAEGFNQIGLKATYLISDNSTEREEVRLQLKDKKINYLFVVDIFNEGVDIPEIDTVLFLRPTESLTVFLQQLGRGLRKASGKDCLTVLDFVGNARMEYDFEKKFRALIGKTNSSTQKEIEDDFPHLPLNCSIILEKKAKEHILSNIKRATTLNKRQLIDKIRSFQYNIDRPLTLKNFVELYNISLQQLYKSKYCFTSLKREAGLNQDVSTLNEAEISRAISLKWLTCTSYSYLNFILKFAKENFQINYDQLNDNEKLMCQMLYYDVWQNPSLFLNIQESIEAIGRNNALTNEIIELIEMLIDKIDFVEKDIDLAYSMPLKVHSRYTRDQICAAFEESSLNKKSSSREGVIFVAKKNTELLFITLQKSEKEYSPTTLYDDYAINETLFHWQSQNSARPDTGKGLTYIEQHKTGKKILLFVREANEDEFGNTMGYVFLGEAKYVDHYGEKPMSITWVLNEPIPEYMWKSSAKMATG